MYNICISQENRVAWVSNTMVHEFEKKKKKSRMAASILEKQFEVVYVGDVRCLLFFYRYFSVTVRYRKKLTVGKAGGKPRAVNCIEAAEAASAKFTKKGPRPPAPPYERTIQVRPTRRLRLSPRPNSLQIYGTGSLRS